MTTDPSVRVRSADPADYAAAGQVCVEAYRADGQLGDDPDTGYASVLADVARRAPGGDVLVAEDLLTGSVVGCVTFVRPGSPYAEISRSDSEAEFRMLAVAPAAQGRGVGAALVRACVDRAVADGYTALVICVRDFSAPAKRLYERIGFTRLAERDWTPAPGVHLEALRLQL